jgi:hypothetical protein
MLFRVLTIGLGAACVFLLATFEPVHVTVVRPVQRMAVPAARTPALSVIDVAASVSPAAIPGLARLGRGEWIRTVNEQPADDDFDADALIRAMAHHGSYLDLAVAAGASDRRVLLLVH